LTQRMTVSRRSRRRVRAFRSPAATAAAAASSRPPVESVGTTVRARRRAGDRGSDRTFALLVRLIDEVRGVGHVTEFLNGVLRILSEEMGFAACAIAVPDSRRRGSCGRGICISHHGACAPDDGGLDQQVIKTGKATLVPAIPVRGVVGRCRVASYSGAYVPLAMDGHGTGVLSAHRAGAPACSTRDLRVLTLVARYLSVAVALAYAHAVLRESAATDHLTGLANRRALHDALKREVARGIRYGQPVSVVLVEVDNFKRINDGHGHLRGDAVLRCVGRLLRGICREMDFAARFGGDEFVLMLPNTPKSGALRVLERLRRRAPEMGRRFGVPLTTSAGIATLPQDGLTADALIEAADQAMYRAKRLGGNRVESA